MSLAFDEKVDSRSHNPNIDSSLTINPPPGMPTSLTYDSSAAPVLPNLEASQVADSFLNQDPSSSIPADQLQTAQAGPQNYTPAKLFQATGDVRSLARSQDTPSGFSVQIYDRHIRKWVQDINFSDIAIRGQLYILWKTAWMEHSHPIDRQMVLEAAALTLHDIQKDNNKWERNYSAARRRDWHPNFSQFYDDVFKTSWAQANWHSIATLPEPPRFLAEMARKLAKNAGAGAGANIHQTALIGDADGEISMSPVAMRTLKLRVIGLEGIIQELREELQQSEAARALLMAENAELRTRFDEIRQKINIS
jgi:hypothetical protein